MTFALTPRTTNRRRFLKGLTSAGVITFVGAGGIDPTRNPLTAWAVPGAGNDTVVVSIFLRGAADGLNIVCPHGDDDYYNQRGAYGLSGAEFSDLDGFFGLHAAFAPLLPHWDAGHLGFVHAVGSHELTRSHFVAQPNMETGLGLGGWLQRAIGASEFAGNAAGLSIGDRISPQLSGPFSGSVVDTVEDAIEAGMSLQVIRPALEALYNPAVAPALESNAVFGALATIDDISDISDPSPGDFPNTGFARDLGEAATLIRADIGVRAVAIDSTGWDHHADGLNRMTTLGTRLTEGLAAFMADLGSHADRVLVLVSSEFGRTVKKNGSEGTDHGHGNVMFALSPKLEGQGGGKVLVPGGWPGLADDDLWHGRDLDITTDFRSVYAEIADRHLGISDTASIFPGFVRENVGLLYAAGDLDGSGVIEGSDVQAVLDGNVGSGNISAADIDGDGDADLTDAMLLAQIVEGN
ncbi:MAG: DUF1501 domain-containing protein [Actinomycetota bacterium]